MPMPPHTLTRWSKSFPTTVSAPLSVFTCSYERGEKSCKKNFSRQCDLRRHQKNHTRPSRCSKCAKRFASSKDVDRHNNSVHNNTLKYFCPYDWCQDFIKPGLQDWFVWGFRRKDHWQKHMRDEHRVGKGKRTVEEGRIDMAVLRGGVWVAVLEGGTKVVELPSPSGSVVNVETDLVSDGIFQVACQMEKEKTDAFKLNSRGD